MKIVVWSRALSLFGFNFVEMAVGFVRMIILTHTLGAYEFGFAAALSATYATFEQITDIAIHRYVFTSPRTVYAEALGAAHAIAILRGFCVGCVVLLGSFPTGAIAESW